MHFKRTERDPVNGIESDENGAEGNSAFLIETPRSRQTREWRGRGEGREMASGWGCGGHQEVVMVLLSLIPLLFNSRGLVYL